MVKKVVKRKVAKKVVSKKAPTKSVALKKNVQNNFINPVKTPGAKIKVSLNSLAFFGVLFLISVVSYSAVSHVMYKQLFFLFSLAFASISVALILVILIYFFYSKIKFSKK
jgi:hypothetical protein